MTGTTDRAARRALTATAAVAAAVALAACGSSPAGDAASGLPVAAQSSPATPSTTAAPPLTLVSASPAAGGALASSDAPITLTFSSPLAAGAADPEVTPATPGDWSASGATITFTPSAQYVPYRPLTITVPAGLRGSDHSNLVDPVTVTYTTPQPSELRVQELLAELQYLPLSFTPAGASGPLVAGPSTTAAAAASTGTTTPPATTSAVAPAAIPVADQPGSFAWRWPVVPPGLGSEWGQGTSDLITTGAVMAFEADHGLTVDGIAGPSVWAALTDAVAAGETDPRPYDYISVSMALPETLTVWQDGADVYSSLANTGVTGASTQTGTYPVYERFVSTTMSGTDPDGTVYHDPGVPWVAYFNGGDAIHGFVRASYGFPQSNGCVELPPSHAQAVYPMDYYGTLVTVG